ncbi:hypothetical protein [Pedobacter endophyticus]|uniref:Uncharacterized protein n=1 Tax=Pedobacter endophyticus TaxID=2789740 RepID=A0A7U3Q4N9_9SPHI|nr:hypothetical protein [Pedobacter endophyticus]QPH38533.1 hypothetical protein IZT61_15775 [Pedobacter endophyticus]QPH38534.1 hypothetical protein IZT61_15780 [Pedobacter endophyticus]QPH38535.1 hypothetical protein IZT61_15785 [Pedobacter endophyticus]QPH38536.1 hypothetical protein IZT61_15790 [Pedobacter endophyticus]
MKTQNNSKLTKKTVFVYKSVKAENNFATHPIGDMSQSIATSILAY